jgi:3-oxoadipyl-CoA thiolase
MLAQIRADDLAALSIQALMQKNPKMDWTAVDDVILGCVNQAGEDNRNVARMATLLAGLRHTVPGITINRLCASGLEAVVAGSRSIRLGETDLVIAGGVESMSRAPYVMGKAENTFARTQKIEDTTLGWRFVNPKLREMYGVDSMAETGERVAREYQISRQDQDAFAVRSQNRYAAAYGKGIFKDEVFSVGEQAKDQQARESNLEGLAKLKGIVIKEGTVTAGNAAGVNDGSVAMLVASEAGVKRHSLTPIARIVAATATAVLPNVMGIGPISAVQKLLSMTNLKISDIDLFELNEAFASQAIAVLRALSLPEDGDYINPNGGSIAIGHPLGATGARLALHASLELGRRQARYAICTLCIGVGQASAVLLERVS